MKKKIGDLTLREIADICKKHDCENCALFCGMNHRTTCTLTSNVPSKYLLKKVIDIQQDVQIKHTTGGAAMTRRPENEPLKYVYEVSMEVNVEGVKKTISDEIYANNMNQAYERFFDKHGVDRIDVISSRGRRARECQRK